MLLPFSAYSCLSGPNGIFAQCNRKTQVVQWLCSHTVTPKCPQRSIYLKTLWRKRTYLILRDRFLYWRWEDVTGGGAQPRLQLLLPPQMAPEVLHGLHNSPTGGHLGISKTLEKARTRFYWPRQKQEIENWCNQCGMCSSRGSPTPKPLSTTSITAG